VRYSKLPLLLAALFARPAAAQWAIRQVATVNGGVAGFGQAVCGDADHDNLPEVSFEYDLGSRRIWTWQTWECEPFNRYALVKAESCFGHPYPGPGLHKGSFIPTDCGDVDNDGLTEMLGDNAQVFGDSTGVYDSVQMYLCLYESQTPHSYVDSLVWRFYYGTQVVACPYSWFPGDLDRDGRKEIIFPGLGRTLIFENRGNDTNALVYSGPPYIAGYAYAWGDFDRDGRSEFVTQRPGVAPHYLFVWECTGDDQYALVDSLTTPYSNGFDMWMGDDLDGDGKPEFYVGFVTGAPGWWKYCVCMYEANDASSYDYVCIDSAWYSGNYGNFHSTCADIDGDGHQELVWSYNAGVRIYKAIANNQFQCVWDWLNPIAPCEANVHCYDMNRNGYQDIVISGSGRTVIYEIAAIQVVSPNGGEQLLPGHLCSIRWRTFDPPRCDSVSLFLRKDTSWQLDTIAHGLPPSETTFTWRVPNIRSDSCKMVAFAYGPGWQYDESDSCFSIAPVGVAEASAPLIRETRLLGVSPNPLAGLARIRFQLRGSIWVRLSVHDVAGRVVRVLEDKPMNAGVYELGWDATRLSPGVYFLSFDAGERHETEKVLLAR